MKGVQNIPWTLGSLISILIIAALFTVYTRIGSNSNYDSLELGDNSTVSIHDMSSLLASLRCVGNSCDSSHQFAIKTSEELKKVISSECLRERKESDEVTTKALHHLRQSLNESRREANELTSKLKSATDKLKILERMSQAIYSLMESNSTDLNKTLSAPSNSSGKNPQLDKTVEKVITEIHKLRTEAWSKDAKISQLEIAVGANYNWDKRLSHGHYNLSKPHPIMAPVASSWRQRSFSPHGYYGFIQYSAYRVAPWKIMAVGMVDRRTMEHQKIKNCTWYGRSGKVISGGLRYIYENHHENKRYTSQSMWCDLSRDTGDEGGYLMGLINDEEVILYNEEPGQMQGPPKEFEFELAYCSPPLHGKSIALRMREWFDYHRGYANVTHFTLYNVNTMDEELRAALSPFFSSGMIDLVEVENMLAFDFFYFGQMMLLYDCAFSMALRARWVFFLDFDEFLYAIPPNTVKGLLAAHEQKSWLTHGSIWWDTHKCLNQTGNGSRALPALQRMVFREPHVYCKSDNKKESQDGAYCLNWKGHRKIIANPRKLYMVQVHAVIFAEGKGVDLNARTELRHNHYRGLNVVSFGKKHCQRVMDASFPEGAMTTNGTVFQRDDSTARIVAGLNKL